MGKNCFKTDMIFKVFKSGVYLKKKKSRKEEMRNKGRKDFRRKKKKRKRKRRRGLNFDEKKMNDF